MPLACKLFTLPSLDWLILWLLNRFTDAVKFFSERDAHIHDRVDNEVITSVLLLWVQWGVNTLRLWQDGRHFPDDIFKCIFLNENVLISIKSSLKFVPKGPFKNIPALVQIMAWHRPGDKPLSEPVMVNLPTQICITRPQWVDSYEPSFQSFS